MDTNQVFEQIKAERERQDTKWGKQNHDLAIWMLILQEEIGEVAKAILENNEEEIKLELIQCAAVLVACIENHY